MATAILQPAAAGDAETLIAEMGARARAAAVVLAATPTEKKAAALRFAAAALRRAEPAILAANATDVANGQANGLTAALIDRLVLDPARLEGIAKGLEAVAALPDPAGEIIDERSRPNGLILRRIRVPIGVIAIIYESRPNVTADAGALCMMSGNAAILRGGSEAIVTSRAIHACLVEGLSEAGLPADAIQLVPITDRAAVGAILTATDHIDMVVPRGGKSLVARVQAEAKVPVLAHLDGICHTYVDAAADAAMALDIVVNAKLRRVGICGATETLLIDRGFADPQPILAALIDKSCELRGTDEVRALDPRIGAASTADWDTEYLEAILSVALVDGVDGAMAHIAAHSSHHTDAIITEDADTAARFLNAVDSAIVMWNASTQFADGGEFGLGAEIGISTGRLHARGPVALEGLTTYKWQVIGTGQTRP